MHSLNPRGLGKLNNLATVAYFVPLCFIHIDKRAHFTTAAIEVPLKNTKNILQGWKEVSVQKLTASKTPYKKKHD